MRNGKRNALIMATAAVAGLVRMSYGANVTWQSAPGTSNWNAANWNPAAPVPPTDALFFATSNTTALNNDFAAGTTFASLNFNTGASAFTLGGNSANFTGGVVVNSANSSVQTINFGFTAGALTLGGDQSGGNNLTLNGNDVASALNFTSMSSVNNLLTIGAGKVLTINGAVNAGSVGVAQNAPVASISISGNELDVNGAFTVGKASGAGRSITNLNMSGLSTFKDVIPSTGTFGVGVESQAVGTLMLANTLNQITAGTLAVGWTANNNSGTSTMYLGNGSNVLNIGTLVIGRGKGVGSIAFNPANSNGSVTIDGIAGGASTAVIIVGSSESATASTGVSALVLAGHNANVQGGTVIIGQQAGNTNTSGVTGTGSVTFDAGLFSAGTLQLANNNSGTSSNGAIGTFVLGSNSTSTGVLNVNNAFRIANVTNTNATSPKANGALVINGGTANINSDITVVGTTGAATGTIVLNGGTLNMMGHQIGTIATANGSVVGVAMPNGAQSAAITNLGGGGIAGAGLNMNGTGNLIIDGPSNTYTGGTAINSGKLIALNNLPTGGAVALNGGTLAGIASVGNLTMQSGTHVAPGSTSIDGSIGTLTANGLTVNGGEFRFDIGASPATSDLVAVANSAAFNGSSTITPNFTNGAAPGDYTLLTSTGLTGTAPTLNVPSTSTRLAFNLHFGDEIANAITLNVSGNAANLTWTGGVNDGSGNFVWDINTTQNWVSNAATNPNLYFDLDTVNFDDTATNRTVTLNTTVSPTLANINNSIGNDYVFTGSGAIGGSANLTKSNTGIATILTNNNYTGTTTVNAGTLVFAGNQSISGPTVINGGTLVVGSGTTSGTLGTTPLVTDNGALVFNRSDNFTNPNPIAGSGIVEQGVTGGNAAAILKPTGTNTYTGATNIKSGTVQAGANSNSLGNINPANGPTGDVNISAGAALDLAGGAAANALNFGPKVFKIVGTGTATSGVIFNTGNQQNNAFENITLTGDATIGGARFDVGRTGTGDTLDLANHTLTVAMNANTVFGILNGTNVTAGTIEVSAGALDLERSVVFQSNVSGSNLILDSGTGLELFQTASGAVSRPIIAKGNNVIGNGDATAAVLDSPIDMQNDLNFQPNASGTPSGTVAGTLTVNGNITEDGGQFGINKNGINTLVLAGSNTFSHAINVNGGTLQLGNANALGVNPQVNLNGNSLRLAGTSITIPSLSGGGTITNGSATPATLTLPTTAGNTYGINPNLQDGAGGGALSITQTGTGTLQLQGQVNTFSGTTTVSAGTLEVQNSFGTGPIVNNNGGTVIFNSGGTITVPGNISGNGVVRQVGSGTTIFSGSSSYSGATHIDNGTLIVNGTLSTGGAVNLNTDQGNPNLAGIGSVGKVTVGPNGGGNTAHISPGTAAGVVGTLNMTSLALAGGNTGFTLDLVSPGNNDLVNISGAATFSTASTLSPNAVAAPGTYTVLTAAGGLTLSTTPTINQPTGTRNQFTLDTSSDPKSLKIVVTNLGASLTWRGDNGNNWDVASTTAWTDNGVTTDQQFFQLDTVTFDDTGINKNVNVGTAVFPTSVTVSNSAGNDYQFTGGGTISGNTGLTKNGAGSLQISITNNYTGTTTVNNGTLVFDHDQQITGPILINGGTLQIGTGGNTGTFGSGAVTDNGVVLFNRNDTFALATGISGTGGLEKQSNGTLVLAANQTYTGLTQIDGGTLQVGSGTTTGALGTGSVTNNGTIVFNRSDTVTVANVISGSGDFVKAGAGQVNLNGSNSYTGPTFITAGTLAINSANSIGDPTSSTSTISLGVATLMANGNIDLGTNRNIVLASTGTINVLNGTKLTVDGNVTQTAAGTFAKNGTGTMVLSGNNSFGTLSILSGTLDFTNDSNLGAGTQTVFFGGSGVIHPLANVTSGKFYYDNSSASNQVNFLIDNGITMTLNRAAGGFRNGGKPMQKLGGGTLVLATDNPQTDTGILINGGTIVFQTSGSTGGIGGGNTISLASNTAAILQNDLSTNYNNATLAADATGFLVTGNSSILVDRQTSGDGVTHTVGSLAFNTGGNTLTVTPGSNVVTTSNGAGLVFAQGVTLNDNGTFNVVNSATAPMTVTLSAPMTGSFGITKTGSGTLLMAGSNTYSGPTTIAGGTLLAKAPSHASIIANAIVNSGTLLLDYTGGATDPAPAVKTALAASYPSGFASGAIRTTNTVDPTRAIGWSDDTTNDIVTVKYTYAGDASLDGKVDTSDFMTLAQNFGSTSANWQTGDFNYDGVVNALDFNAIATNFGQAILPAPPLSAPLGTLVPEPTSLSVLAIAGTMLGARRRRQK